MKARSSARLEHLPDTQRASGSTPLVPTKAQLHMLDDLMLMIKIDRETIDRRIWLDTLYDWNNS